MIEFVFTLSVLNNLISIICFVKNLFEYIKLSEFVSEKNAPD